MAYTNQYIDQHAFSARNNTSNNDWSTYKMKKNLSISHHFYRGLDKKSSIPSIILHIFCIFILATLVVEKDGSAVAAFFTIPTLFIMTPIILYIRNDENIFIFSQYIFVSIYALIFSLGSESATTYSSIVLFLIFLFKIRARTKIPPLGPGFVYVYLHSILFTDSDFFASSIIIWSTLAAILSLKNKYQYSPILTLLAFRSMLDYSDYSEAFSSYRLDAISASLSVLIIYISRIFRLNNKIENNYFSGIEEITASLFLSFIITDTFNISNHNSYFILGSLYLILYTFFQYLSFRNNKIILLKISNTALIGSLFSFCAAAYYINYSFNYAPNWFITCTIISTVNFATLFINRKHFDHITTYAMIFLTMNQFLVLKLGEPSIKSGEYFLQYVLCSTFNISIFLYAFSKTYNNSNSLEFSNGLLSKKDFVIVRRWVKSSWNLMSSLPIIGMMLKSILYMMIEIKESFSKSSKWNIEKILIISSMYFIMISFSDITYALFDKMNLLPSMEDIDNKIINTREVSFRLASFSIFGSIVVFSGTLLKWRHLVAIGIFVPFGGIFFYYIKGIINRDVPLTIFFVSCALLYIGARYSVSFFSQRKIKSSSEKKPISSQNSKSLTANSEDTSIAATTPHEYALLFLIDPTHTHLNSSISEENIDAFVKNTEIIIEKTYGKNIVKILVTNKNMNIRISQLINNNNNDYFYKIIDDFKNIDILSSPKLIEITTAFNIKHLIISGYETGLIVRFTANDAINRGFKLSIIGENCYDADEILNDANIKYFISKYENIISIDDLDILIDGSGTNGRNTLL